MTDRPPLIALIPDRDQQHRLVEQSDAARDLDAQRKRASRRPDRRDDLPAPIPARDQDYHSAWG